MKKVLSIALALGLALTMGLATVPAGAVTEGTVTVIVQDCTDLAGETGVYIIFFHNDGLLLGGEDHIDVLFPTGTELPDPVAPLAFQKGASATIALGLHATIAPTALNVTANRVSDKTVRFAIDDGFMVDKCEWVAIIMTATNPSACDYHLQVGTSVAGPYTSNDYRIYSAKVTLQEGKNLVALPAYPVDTSIEVVLAGLFEALADEDIEEFSVWYWDAWEQEWLVYASDTSFADLTTIEAGKAYWIKVDDEVTFKFKGEPYPECQGPPQKWCYPPSWSMIGAAAEGDIWASAYLKDAMLPWPHQNTYAVSTIIGFDADEQVFTPTTWDPGQKNDPGWKEDPDEGDYLLEFTAGYFMSFIGEACIVPPIPAP